MLTFLLLACAGDLKAPQLDDTDDTAAPTLAIASLTPSSGPAGGGTPVTVRGEGFTPATLARVGETPCASLTFLGAGELLCVTPPGVAGARELTVLEGALSARATYTYLPADTGTDTADTGTADTGTDTGGDTGTNDTGADTGTSDTGADTATSDTGSGGTDTGAATPVDYCHLQWPCTMTKAPGATSDAVYAWIYHRGVTVGPGAGTGLRVEVGVGPSGSVPATDVGWTWGAMAYNVDKDGLVPGDLANDEYAGTFVAPSRGAWDYCARVSLDGGTSWTYCDGGGESCPGDGTDDGYTPADAGQLQVR